MNFTDSIQDGSINPFIAQNRNGELSKRCEKLMARFGNTFDKAYTLFLVDYNERKKERVVKPVNANSLVIVAPESTHENLELVQIACCEYMMFCLDVLTAYRYLIEAKTDWDYRFFARRIYTLMHEAQQMFNHRNQWINNLKEDLDIKDFEAYCQAKKQFDKYIQKYDSSEFLPVRLGVEAHRDKEIYNQFQAVFFMSVAKSAPIIQEGFEVMVAYSDELLALMDKMFKKANRIRIISWDE